ncbi:outer membrane protein [Gaetbulibacter aestuarii]|uniref:Outer membrane beta-barrel protein n=1 Tax=Gaetbulibacter aestuarii TaxID=1502358 RepID=A0ABW7N0B2_9FLAO
MKQKLLLLFLLTLTINTFSQERKFSLELNYPIVEDQNFLGENYNGIIDLGFKYRFANFGIINLGGGVNASILDNVNNYNYQGYKVFAYSIQPKLFAEINAPTLKKLHPVVGLGFTLLRFDVSGVSNSGFDLSNASETLSGFDINLGLSYDLTNRIFIQAQYDFIKINPNNGVPDIQYNTNVNIWKIGLGYGF